MAFSDSGGSVWIYTMATDNPPSWDSTKGAARFRRIIDWIEKVDSVSQAENERRGAGTAGENREGLNKLGNRFEIWGMEKKVENVGWEQETKKRVLWSGVKVFECAPLEEVPVEF